MKYATFRQRFVALWVDGFVLLPFGILFMWLEGKSKSLAYVIYFVRYALFSAYHIYCHGRYGKTIGKHSVGIGLVQLDGERITWRQAWLRSSVDLCLGAVSLVATYMILGSVPDTEYYVEWAERMRNFKELKPAWVHWLNIIGRAWILSEVVVMLFNERRRAIHDFIAGTVVIADFDGPTSWPQFEHPSR